MTQEEKARRYDDALKLARDYYKANLKLDKADENLVLEDIFPELKESDDEEIRKALLEYFGEECDTATINGIYCYKIYAWLEKQGEQKSTWSEEDETGWTNTMIMIKEAASHHYTKDSIKLVIDWLKSLKERMGG